VDKSNWCPSQWQAHISRLEPFSERKRVLEKEVPPEYRDRVLDHLKTVKRIAQTKKAVEKYHKRVAEERKKRV